MPWELPGFSFHIANAGDEMNDWLVHFEAAARLSN